MLYASVLRPPAHGAKLLRVDSAALKEIAGVVLVQEPGLVAVLHELPDVAEDALGKLRAEFTPSASPLADRNIYDHREHAQVPRRVVHAGGDLKQGRILAVQVCWTCEEEFFNDTFRPAAVVQVKAGLEAAGRIAPGEWVRYTVRVEADGGYARTARSTAKFGGHISIDCDGVDVTGPIAIPATFNLADPIEWRQAHHWNKIKAAAKLPLKNGLHVLTLHFLDQPVMNFDYLDFAKVE